jgi:hypothetical protein
VFLLDIFLFDMMNSINYLHRARCGFCVFIYAKTNFYLPIWDSWYHKSLKSGDYFQNINVNVVFWLNMLLFYMKNFVEYLHHDRCEFYVLIYVETNFYIPILECRYDKVLKIHDYSQNINIYIVFQLNIFYFICKTPLNICTILIVVFMSLYMWK